MGKPTAEELQQALDAAIKMREGGNDPDHIAKSLLNLNYRVICLEHVLAAAQRYLHSGQSSIEHRKLLAAIAAAEKSLHQPESEDEIPTLVPR